MCDHRAYEIFAVASGGNSARAVIGVSSRADNGRIADPAKFLIGNSARRSSCRKIPFSVKRDRSDSPVFMIQRVSVIFLLLLLGRLFVLLRFGSLRSLLALQSFKARLDIKITLRD